MTVTRDYVINGETMVFVRFGEHIQSPMSPMVSGIDPAILPGPAYEWQLGLTAGEIRVSPRPKFRDINVDDYSPEVPAEVLANIADADIRMTLVHYDPQILDICFGESMGGINPVGPWAAGQMVGAGTMLGGGLPIYSSGSHYIGLRLSSPVLNRPWRFPTCYLTGSPLEIPLGTERTLAVCGWRAIPYGNALVSVNPGSENPIYNLQEVRSSGMVLWDRSG